ncbi:hypothetical protein HWB57_gp031 [Erwinia phage vB_EamM-Bue1]|uniref:Uncharacterized protein n=1 Tax=Erwinia phage vB_EamM-Bue1 TaxID=2099338 RepID=A0A2P1JU39_9CAUD|nr:hypothetical protein HWB57_gp031 [Erwinia phage vB_EamM-Bue1]AVO22874.1 hypothetical protein [Erwinia phage vB_EamM-Bue1]
MKEHQPINPKGLKISLLTQQKRDLKDTAMLSLIEIIENLEQFKTAHAEFHNKTEIVQTDPRFKKARFWGMHRADVLVKYIEELETQLTQTREVARAALGYIDAIPQEAADAFPTMPGFDRDWANEILEHKS